MPKIQPKIEEFMEVDRADNFKNKKTKKIFPRFRIEHQFIPITKDWEVAKTYKLELELKMTGLSISRFDNSSEFDIIGFEDKTSNKKDDEN